MALTHRTLEQETALRMGTESDEDLYLPLFSKSGRPWFILYGFVKKTT